MQNNNNKKQMSVGLMIQRCHRLRQKRKQYMDQARQTSDSIERERILQMAEHYGRVVNEEQSKIDTSRDPRDKCNTTSESVEEKLDEEENGFPDFISQL
ncbi:MAG: hypothetical protein ACOX7D_00995 [Alphaproteobacteria bacterium]|jgi:hypothetical protein|nr:hypothetical protein [Alphaproteobacteria bacterium]